jgi:SAM-dependent methyltransferase
MNPLGLLEHPLVYGFSQKLNPMTVGLYRRLLSDHVAAKTRGPVLDIGCGVGAHRQLFPTCEYVGIDVNPEYIAAATRAYGSGFFAMDAGAMTFPAASFEAAFSVATCHHLDDERIRLMTSEVMRILRPNGAFHIIDPVLPTSSRAALKRLLFQNDRGRHQRTVSSLTGLLARFARIQGLDLRSGVLHDVCYIRLTP